MPSKPEDIYKLRELGVKRRGGTIQYVSQPFFVQTTGSSPTIETLDIQHELVCSIRCTSTIFASVCLKWARIGGRRKSSAQAGQTREIASGKVQKEILLACGAVLPLVRGTTVAVLPL